MRLFLDLPNTFSNIHETIRTYSALGYATTELKLTEPPKLKKRTNKQLERNGNWIAKSNFSAQTELSTTLLYCTHRFIISSYRSLIPDNCDFNEPYSFLFINSSKESSGI